MNLGEKRNKLNELANGDIIVCFDDDDYHYPERITYSVYRLNQERANLAGCSTVDIYYTNLNKIYTFGPFGQNHGTNGTFAYRKSYIKNHSHDPTKNAQEEPSFTNDFKEQMVQLNKDKIIMCISHDTNTFDKNILLGQAKQETTTDLRKKFKKDKVYLKFFDELCNEMKK